MVCSYPHPLKAAESWFQGCIHEMLGENPAERSDIYGSPNSVVYHIPYENSYLGSTPQVQNGMVPCQTSSKSWFTTEFHQQGQSCHKTASNIRSGYIKPNIQSMYQYPQK